MSVAPATTPGDMVVPIHAQVGSTALELVLGMAEKMDSLQQVINAYLGSVPGWHLTGSIDKTPSYCGAIDGNVIVGANGMLKSACVTVTASADIAGAVEGYYGISVLHVGVGAAADLAVNVNATASYSIDTNTWYFGGAAALDGSVKGYAAAMAWPLKGEVYIKGDLAANAAIRSDTGLASASIVLAGSVGVQAQMKSLFGGWTTIANASRSLGSWQYSANFDVGAWLRSEVNGVVVTTQNAKLSTMLGSASQAKASTLAADTSTSSSAKSVVADNLDHAALALQAKLSVPNAGATTGSRIGAQTAADPTTLAVASSSRTAAAIQGAALQQLNIAETLLDVRLAS